MRCRSLALVAPLVALNAVLACESGRPVADDLLRIDAGEPSRGGAPGQGPRDASVPPPDAATDAATDAALPDVSRPDAGGPSVCEQASEAFRSFVAANRGCSLDSDCTMIGDCEPNADFEAINVAAAAMGYALMMVRCASIADGPTFAAICQDGQCVRGPENGCCGCPSDAGLEG